MSLSGITDIGCKSFIKRQNGTFKAQVRTVLKNLLVWFMMGRNWKVSVLQLTGEESFMAGVAS